MSKKFFTTESLATLVNEIKKYVANAILTKADSSHSHTITDVDSLQDTLNAKATQGSLDSHVSDTSKHITEEERTNWNAAKTHADSAHVTSVNGMSGDVVIDIPTDYLTAIPEEYITETELNAKGYLTSFTETDPTVPAWAKEATKPTYTASEVGALPADTVIPTVPTNVSSFTNDAGYLTEHQSLDGLATETYANTAVSNHNTNNSAHNDIRDLISGLTTRLNALADSDDTTLDQMSEVVAYIKSNKTLIEQVTTNKVNVSDIINNLTTNVSDKPLSAAQGVALKALIDAIVVPTKVSELTNDSGYITGYTETDPTVPAWAKASTKPTYTKSEVGLGNVDNVKQYSANNPPPYPVTSVNGVTGAVTVKAVPNCSTSNNGQFLRVINGVAAWSTVPNAEEATF